MQRRLVSHLLLSCTEFIPSAVLPSLSARIISSLRFAISPMALFSLDALCTEQLIAKFELELGHPRSANADAPDRRQKITREQGQKVSERQRRHWATK